MIGGPAIREGFKTIIPMSLVAVVDGGGALFRQPEPICSFVSRGRKDLEFFEPTTPSAPREKETRHADGI